MTAASTREFNDLPWGDELFPYLLPWALEKQSYTNIEARQNCTKAAGLSIEQQTRRQADGKQIAWVNYVAFALKQMTELGLHTSVQRPRGIKQYSAIPAKIRAYVQSAEAKAIVLGDSHNPILADFEKAIVHHPVETEILRLVKQRVGQDILRRWLIEDRDCRCGF
ncbi:hypothetical protein [Rhodopila sp.]|uniref:hypothetical protein n=1 Tax=Rhodopila sp. TaxID=2480087 RepID=UPI003D0AD70E